jgi:hypothetical protein
MQAAIVGADGLLADLAGDLGARRAICRAGRDARLAGERDRGRVEDSLSELYRQEHRQLAERLLEAPSATMARFSPLARRSVRNRPLVRRAARSFRSDTTAQAFAARHVDAFLSRMMLTPLQSLQVYDALQRAYVSRLARTGALT